MANYSQIPVNEASNTEVANDDTGHVDAQPDDTHRMDRIHWRVPTVMIASAVSGILFAISHHYFYLYFDKRRARSANEQSYVINVGTALAFLVKIFLAIATGTAYVQQLWLHIKKSPKSVSQVDALFSILHDATLFWNMKLWFTHLALAVLAVVTW